MLQMIMAVMLCMSGPSEPAPRHSFNPFTHTKPAYPNTSTGVSHAADPSRQKTGSHHSDQDFHYVAPFPARSVKGSAVLRLFNPGNTSLDLEIQVFDGQDYETLTMTLPPKATVEPLGELGQDRTRRWLAIASSQPLSGTLAVDAAANGRTDRFRYPVFQVTPAHRTLIFPRAAMDHPARSGYVLVNPNDEPANFQFKLYSADGQSLDHLLAAQYQNNTLAAKTRQAGVFACDVFDDHHSNQKVAWLEVVADQPLAGLAVFRGYGNNQIAALEARPAEKVSQPRIMPFSQEKGRTQIFSLTNTSAVDSTALIQGYDGAGATLFREFALVPAKSQLLGLMTDDGFDFPSQTPQIQLDETTAATLKTVRITANQPVALYQVTQTHGRGMAASAAAQPAEKVALSVPDTEVDHQLLIQTQTKSADQISVRGYNNHGAELFHQTLENPANGRLVVDLPTADGHAAHVEINGSQPDTYLSAFLRSSRDNRNVVSSYRASEDSLRRQLLDDEALASPVNPTMGQEPQAWADWIADNHHPIRSLESDDYSDLCFLEDVLADKRVVQLGENSHGIREYNRGKVRMIKYLHEELGYDVIAFESSIFSTYNTWNELDEKTSFEAMTQSIFGVWYTDEVLELFTYIKERAATDRPLIFSGFDVQSTSSASLLRPQWFADTIAPVDAEYAAEVSAADSEFANQLRSGRGNFYQWFLPQVDTVRAGYTGLVDWIDANHEALVAAFPDDPQRVLYARQFAWSSVQFVDNLFQQTQNPFMALQTRDTGMAGNVNFLLDEIFPDKKMIIWAHNGHLHKDGPELFWIETMGGLVAQARGEEVYTVGFYMGGGWSANNGRQPYAVGPYPVNSLESILYNAGRKHMFVDLENQVEVPGNSWMFQQILGHDWGVIPELWTPKNQWDGIFFVDTTSTPYYSFQ